MSRGTLLVIVLILLLIITLPAWPYSTAWGYFPSAGLGIALIVLLVLMMMRRI